MGYIDLGVKVRAGINVPIPVPVTYHSFGGWKASIFGDHGVYGMEGVRFYTKLKSVTARWPTGIRAGAELRSRRGIRAPRFSLSSSSPPSGGEVE